MKLDVYLNYAGNCQQAFRFYEKVLGGTITTMMTHGQGPMPRTSQPSRRTRSCMPASRSVIPSHGRRHSEE